MRARRVSLFWEQLQFLYVNQSTMSLFADGMFDSLGHGTAVAGLLHVVAPEARLVPIRAFDARGNRRCFSPSQHCMPLWTRTSTSST